MPDGIVTFTSPSWDVSDRVKLWSLNPATGEENPTGPAPEPSRNQETLVVSRAGRQIGRFRIETDTCAIFLRGLYEKVVFDV